MRKGMEDEMEMETGKKLSEGQEVAKYDGGENGNWDQGWY